MSAGGGTATWETLPFDNRSLRKLPIDPDKSNTIRQVPGACFSLVQPDPLLNPKLVAVSPEALGLLDLAPSEWQRPDAIEYLSGNKHIPGSRPAAHCYCGHQFGVFAGQLGDGAAMYLGEVVNARGERWELQFKGSGKTPYSRMADGRKVLRSSIREFLCSEAMFHLGIPTTRAGSIVTSDSRVSRDTHYTGNAVMERVSVITRIAPTFIRFGSFEIFKPLLPGNDRAGPSAGQWELMKKMLDFVVESYFPQVWSKHSSDRERYQHFFREVCRLTGELVAAWQCVGFCHGVLNTDNMSILGLTLDYGPFGFLDAYNPDHVCNGSDDQGRYDFKSQKDICKWNLQMFAVAIEHYLPADVAKAELKAYDDAFNAAYSATMRKKLGLLHAAKDTATDAALIDTLLDAMAESGADFTNTFLVLSKLDLDAPEALLPLIRRQQLPREDALRGRQSKHDPAQILTMMSMYNANAAAFQAHGITLAYLQEQLMKLQRLSDLADLSDAEYEEMCDGKWRAFLKLYAARCRHDRDQHAGGGAQYLAARAELMAKTNPVFILRNHIAQRAIERAEKGDFSEVNDVLERLRHPFDAKGVNIDKLTHVPAHALDLCITCSS
eukprot:m.110812 g.110812  ORF g.110812 m.110812 type:complete len:609 (-) comp15928_c0_seq1:586-2412(-)